MDQLRDFICSSEMNTSVGTVCETHLHYLSCPLINCAVAPLSSGLLGIHELD